MLHSIARRFFATGHPTAATDAIVLGAWTENGTWRLSRLAQWADETLLNGRLLQTATALDFKGKLGETRVFYSLGASVRQRVVLVGLGGGSDGSDGGSGDGDVDGGERARVAMAAATQVLMGDKQVKSVALDTFQQVQGAVEGALLSSYRFDRWITDKNKRAPVSFVPLQSLSDEEQEEWQRGTIAAEAQNLARTWMNAPANTMTPKDFVSEAERVLSSTGSQCDIIVHEEEWMSKMKMNAFLSVAKGSIEPPKFLEIHIRNAPQVSSAHLALVGKGITFDSGGISIKPSAGMALMKGDMGGAAVVLATMVGIAKRQLPINVSAFIPLCENMPSGNASKPGDVVVSMDGKTIEIDNTDAEGRLILADALCYSIRHSKLQPKHVIDVATLTALLKGAMDVALGNALTGFFCNNDQLSVKLNEAGKETGDRLWRMPLHPVYKSQIKSDVADLKNVGGRGAGACTAAAFLQSFVGSENKKSKQSWAHLDIAGVMNHASTHQYNVKGMSGRPTRTLLRFSEKLAKE